jgi:hypothetical protein
MFSTVDTRAGYLEIIEAMAGLDPPLFVFGGIAEDALLDHELSRPHSDIDVMVLRGELGQRLRQCEALGFDGFEVYYEPVPGSPLVLGGHRGSLNLELGILDKDRHGHYFTVADRAGERYNIYLPEDSFAYPVTRIGDTPIQTLSPLALYQIRAGLDITRTFGGLRPKDIAAQRRLRAAFLADRAEEALRPRIEGFGPAGRR